MRVSLALAVLAAGALVASLAGADTAGADTAVATDTLADCLTRIAPKTAPGLDRLRSACPDLEQIIVESGMGPQLGSRWRARLRPQGLKDLAGLMQRYQARPTGAAPDPAALATITRELRAPPTNRSWWRRLTDWLRDLLLRPTDANSGNWLKRLLSKTPSVPAAVQQLLFYLTLAAIVVLAVLIVWRELKISGVGAGRGGGTRLRRTMQSPPPMSRALDLRDLDAASAWDRPVILSRLLVQALALAGRVQREGSLTYRELAQHGVFDSREQQQRFARVSLLAEQRLYGPEQLSPVAQSACDVEQTVMDGRQLYTQLKELPQ